MTYAELKGVFAMAETNVQHVRVTSEMLPAIKSSRALRHAGKVTQLRVFHGPTTIAEHSQSAKRGCEAMWMPPTISDY
jgi:hypothetical protein